MQNESLWNAFCEAKKRNPGLSITKLARICGMQQSKLSNIVHGVKVTDREKQSLARALGTPVDEIFPPEEYEPPVVRTGYADPPLEHPVFNYMDDRLPPHIRVLKYIEASTFGENRTSFQLKEPISRIEERLKLSQKGFFRAVDMFEKSKFLKFDRKNRIIRIIQEK